MDFDKEIVINEIRASNPINFYRRYILGNAVWYFSHYLLENNPSHKYDLFKEYINERLDIHINNIAIIGSAKLGFSLSPKKDFRDFNDESDIDVVLVCPKLFNLFWEEYMDMFGKYQIISNYKYVSSCIFRKFISLDGIAESNDLLLQWNKKVNGFLKDLDTIFGFEHKVNYRIYDSWDAVESYYLRNIRILQNQLLGGVS